MNPYATEQMLSGDLNEPLAKAWKDVDEEAFIECTAALLLRRCKLYSEQQRGLTCWPERFPDEDPEDHAKRRRKYYEFIDTEQKAFPATAFITDTPAQIRRPPSKDCYIVATKSQFIEQELQRARV